MPTLPLMTIDDDPQSRPRVRAPGGYVSEYFHASSTDGRTHILAGLHFGYALDAQYARRYVLYRMFPTRLPPPDPMAHPSVSLATMHEGRIVRHALERRSFDAESDRVMTSGADLLFKPRIYLGPVCDEIVEGHHHVQVTAPRCDVVGTIGSMAFEGMGCRVQRFGSRWPRETGGWISGVTAAKAQATLVYGFGERAHVLDVSGDACKQREMDVAAARGVGVMLWETIAPWRFASRLC